MDRFCVITNSDKDKNLHLAGYLSEYLTQRGKRCEVMENELSVRNGVRNFTDITQISCDTQCAIVLGGDGTMIQAAIDLVDRELPILGINIGTVGFLAEVERQNIDLALERLLKDDFIIENRIMLKSTLCQESGSGDSCYALNDIVISKRGTCRLITIKVYINGELADIYRADGIIVATPTGSTGYNLSAGGPVMAPHTHATVITPICAHSLNKRSLVLDAGDKIEVEIGQTKEAQLDTAVMAADGHNVGELITSDRLMIEVPSSMTQLIKLSNIGFYERMRDKLNGN